MAKRLLVRVWHPESQEGSHFFEMPAPKGPLPKTLESIGNKGIKKPSASGFVWYPPTSIISIYVKEAT